jgi:hypothetical protein
LVVNVVRRYPVAVLAVLVTLGGTGAAARTLITGAGIEDGTLRSADFRDGSLTRSDFSRRAHVRGIAGRRGPAGPPGPPGPQGTSRTRDVPLAHASVAADGAVQPGGSGVAVTHSGTGEYCAVVAGARWVQVAAMEADQVAAAALVADRSCPIRVSIAGVSGAFEDGGFQLLVRNG